MERRRVDPRAVIKPFQEQSTGEGSTAGGNVSMDAGDSSAKGLLKYPNIRKKYEAWEVLMEFDRSLGARRSTDGVRPQQ
jgi:hypothetical protein